MKKIKIYVVTYKAPDRLKLCLDSIVESDVIYHDYEVYVINNFGSLYLDKRYQKFNITILNNEARPDFSCGHLSRNWNQAIVNGFVDLKNPDCEIVLTIQDDVEVQPGFFKSLVDYHKKYNFISVGTGDDFMSFTIEAIKSVGLFDERFFNIGFQHEEYFMRQVAFNRTGSTINDFHHWTFHNRIYPKKSSLSWTEDEKSSKKYKYYNGYNDLIKHKLCGFLEGSNNHMSSLRYHSYAGEFLRSKWQFDSLPLLNMYTRTACSGASEFFKIKMYNSSNFFERVGGYIPFTAGPFEDWDGDPDGNLFRCLEKGLYCRDPQPILYPYFELDIENRVKLGYSY